MCVCVHSRVITVHACSLSHSKSYAVARTRAHTRTHTHAHAHTHHTSLQCADPYRPIAWSAVFGSWDGDNWGILDNDAGRAYYASLATLYASWGVDFVKVMMAFSRFRLPFRSLPSNVQLNPFASFPMPISG